MGRLIYVLDEGGDLLGAIEADNLTVGVPGALPQASATPMRSRATR